MLKHANIFLKLIIFLIPYLLSVLLVQLHLEDQDLPVEIIQDRKKSKIIGIKGQLQLSISTLLRYFTPIKRHTALYALLAQME